ncbi:unnamed protein product [Danaus chrysippus]|uniref:(African queen) hypothetical protein n=1 Tax=Danaus chrysippus TaxID=151541 RepID=A0A8J2QMW1_9NEOP|nr:unnamed protein product [Danaus chrysippus]
MNGATASDQLDKLDIKCSGETHENVEDSPNICRICATVTDLVIPIFEGEGLQNNLAEKIHKHLPIKVSVQDVLPRVVCYQCSSTVLAWHELVQCCQQADQALRQQAANRKKKPVEVTGTPSDPKGLNLLTSIVTDVLNDYCQMLNINQDNSDIYYVCQECDGHPVSSSIETLSQHLQLVHSELSNEKLIEQFIKDNIFIEEVLISDELLSSEDLSKQAPNKELPNYSCPFCESMFSSPTRLVFHLNRHLEVCIDDGVYCCNQLFNNKTFFVTHLQSQHVHKVIDSSRVCKSCGLTAGDLDELQKHINDNHPQAEERYERGKTEGSPKCQKFIPAVCSECNKTFSNKYNMLVHMRNHFGQPSRFACDKCNKTYKSQGSLIYHHKVVHEGQLKFVCSSCGEAFPSRAARDVHARLHTGQKPFSCQYCGKAYRAKNTLYRHIDMHLNIRKYACSFCDKKWIPSPDPYFLKRREFKIELNEPTHSNGTERVRGHHRHGSESDEDDKPLAEFAAARPSDIYRNFYRALTKFRDHYVQHEFKRDRCSDLSNSSDSEEERNWEELDPVQYDDLSNSNMRKDKMNEETRLELSQVQTKINGKTYYICKICDKKLSSSHTYIFHKRIHTGERPCICHVCGKQFRAPNGLQRHLTETHERLRRYTCQICHKSFANSQNLKQHMRIHTGERPFVCSHCGKRFTQSGSLHVHLKTHSATLPHACRDCGAKFRMRSGLTRHRLKHTGERPHVCRHCGKGFRQKHEMNAHALTHSDSKPHVCTVCGTAFRQRRALRHHCKRLHDSKPGEDAHVYNNAINYILTLNSV